MEDKKQAGSLSREKELETHIYQLKKQLKRLQYDAKKRRYGLVWMDVPEAFDSECENKLPILREEPEKAVVNEDDKATHILIEGDNYHALTCLNYTHKGKIDVIYIDPPYNTGAKDWKYNNDYVDKNDPWRHSKWINFMNNRLLLAKRLLKKNGVLICAIDENEHAALGLLLEHIFPNYKIDCITIVHNPRGVQGDNFSYCHEYAFFVYPENGKYIGRKKRDEDDAEYSNLRNWGGESTRKYGKSLFYPIYFKSDGSIELGSQPENDFHPTEAHKKHQDGTLEFWPIDNNGIERKWRYSRSTLLENLDLLKVNDLGGILQVQLLKNEDRYKTVWTDKKYDSNSNGTQLVNEILGKKFPFPKSLYNVKECLDAVAQKRKDAIILDFFAGSGTTAHAVMAMNQADGGSRQFIVCTNNEGDICKEITHPRIEKVMNGYPFKGKDKKLLYEKKITATSFKKATDILSQIDFIKLENEKQYDKFETKIEDNHIRLYGIQNIDGQKDGLGGSLKYYIADFVGKNNIINATDEDRIEIAHQAGDLLSIAENTLYKVSENDFYQLYENNECYTAVYFREELDKFDDFVEMVEKLDYPTTVYVFSWGDDEFDYSFEHINGIKVKTIPLPILEIYKNIYNLGK